MKLYIGDYFKWLSYYDVLIRPAKLEHGSYRVLEIGKYLKLTDTGFISDDHMSFERLDE